MVENRYEHVINTYRTPGDAVEGDHLLIYCRKPDGWQSKIRAAEGHHYYKTNAKMNALAVIRRTFRNLQK